MSTGHNCTAILTLFQCHTKWANLVQISNRTMVYLKLHVDTQYTRNFYLILQHEILFLCSAVPKTSSSTSLKDRSLDELCVEEARFDVLTDKIDDIIQQGMLVALYEIKLDKHFMESAAVSSASVTETLDCVRQGGI